MPTPKFKSFIFYTGYAEDQSISCLLLTHGVGFDTVQDALADIDRLLRERAGEEAEDLKACCKKTQDKDSEAEFCSKCGHYLEDNDEADVPTGEMFTEHFNAINDSDEYWEIFHDNGWSHDSDEFDWENHVTIERAEEVIPESVTEAWNRQGQPPRSGAWKTVADYAAYHVHCFNKKMKSRILR